MKKLACTSLYQPRKNIKVPQAAEITGDPRNL